MKVKELMKKVNEYTPITEIVFSVNGKIIESFRTSKYYNSYSWKYDTEFWDSRTVIDFSYSVVEDKTLTMWIDCKEQK